MPTTSNLRKRQAEESRNQPDTAISSTVTECPNKKRKKGPYSHLEDPPDVGPYNDFTADQKRAILDENRKRNGGVLRDDDTGEELVPSQKSRKGVTPPENEAQVDHVYPKSKGGTNSYKNAKVISRKRNREKSNKV
ncbi:MAG: HNH endonuclease domain-containing protein [Candidatus Contendobacter sp.]|nr:HNH endonuclease domain-containing protein [Candidatus Contendobacter sp.]